MKGRERSLEWWIAILRLAAIPFAVAQVATTKHYPPHYEAIAWALTLVLAVAAKSARAPAASSAVRSHALRS